MILQALECHYHVLLDSKTEVVPSFGYSAESVNFAALISEEGHLLDLIDMRVEDGKKLRPRTMFIPERVKRSSGISANVLCENSKYIFGYDEKGDTERSVKCFTEFKRRNIELLDGSDDPESLAFVKFLENWKPHDSPNHEVIQLYKKDLKKGGNIIIQIEGYDHFLHQNIAIRKVWEISSQNQADDWKSRCLITGHPSPIARTHPSIKGVVGAQSSGASIVSFNNNAFCSYGRSGEQGWNAPIGKKATFAYTTALNYLTSSKDNHIRFGDTTIVFWAEKPGTGTENVFELLLNPERVEDEESETVKADDLTDRTIRGRFQALYGQRLLRENYSNIDRDVKFYILGLAPNASRLSVRFWHMDNFGNIFDGLMQHYSDIEVVDSRGKSRFTPLWMILNETAVKRDSKRVSPLLGGNLMRSILNNGPYPITLHSLMLQRIRADRSVNGIRAGVIKGYLIRQLRHKGQREKEALYTVGLNRENKNVGYLLGRLFAVLEKTQKDANPNVGSSVRDRYFGSAMSTPELIFPNLVRFTQHHLAKSKYEIFQSQLMTEIISDIDGYPKTLLAHDQGQFTLGYYHQVEALYTKKEIAEVQNEQSSNN